MDSSLATPITSFRFDIDSLFDFDLHLAPDLRQLVVRRLVVRRHDGERRLLAPTKGRMNELDLDELPDVVF